MHKRFWKFLGTGFLLILLLLLAFFHELIGYGIFQAKGQLNIIWHTQTVNEILKDASVADSIKQKLLLIEEIKKFAVDSLGINPSENYTTYYEHGNRPLLWVVTASAPFDFKEKTWAFPLLGSFSYKGFFDSTAAVQQQNILIAEGFDTEMEEVGAWSTLGWFKDPIFTWMLKKKPGNLANTIIHELTHGTLYVKNNVEYNENLASFVGDIGAKKFLVYKYGVNSPELFEYERRQQFVEAYAQEVLKYMDSLQNLYNHFSGEMTDDEKLLKKNNMMQVIRDSLQFKLDQYYGKEKKVELKQLNNTYFLDYKRYRARQDVFYEEFVEKFNSNFPLYLNYLKKKYPSL